MLAYADQNFLINCVNNPIWGTAIKAAIEKNLATIILSPWHFFEIGTIDSKERLDELIQIAEEFKPTWILERSDLQVAECSYCWQRFWGHTPHNLRPFGSIHDVASVLLNCQSRRLAGLTLRNFVEVFRRTNNRSNLTSVMDSQKSISADNRISFKSGSITRQIREAIERRYVARLLARQGESGSSEFHLNERTERLLSSQPVATKIAFFVEFGGMADMKCYAVESALTVRHFETEGSLGINRQVDRQHATVALSYCDRFVTSDRELLRRCQDVRDRLTFSIAKVQTGDDFIDSLQADL